MGVVYAGKDDRNGEPVAIKALRGDLISQNPGWVARFRREGESLRALNHPNIVKMLAAVEENGRYFIVMEFVTGGTLEERLTTSTPMPLEEAIHIALQLADALTRSHYLGIIHRDVKPANVLLTEDGIARLTDFGLARVQASSMTEAGEVLGTLHYLSPESFQGRPSDEQSDIWSFGVVLYEMLTGCRPFDGEVTGAILNAILSDALPDLTALRPDIPPLLVDLIQRMLQRDLTYRISSVRQVGAQLESTQRSLAGETHLATTISHLQPAASPASTTRLKIQLFGPPALSWDDQALEMPRRQARALIYFLAAAGHPVTRDQLILLLWPDIPEARARRNLTRLLSYLRQMLPDEGLMITQDSSVSLNFESIWCDAYLFDQLDSTRPAPWIEGTVELYGGAFLYGFYLDNCPEYDLWTSQTRQRYERLYLEALRRLVDTLQEEGDLERAISNAHRYLEIDELAEDMHRRLIMFYGALGDRASVQRLYEACVVILERDLGVGPLPETRAAYEAALKEQPFAEDESLSVPRVQVAWTTLPGLDLPLLGREESWQQLLEAYNSYGSGGVFSSLENLESASRDFSRSLLPAV
jgi:serine/threonine protein kinase